MTVAASGGWWEKWRRDATLNRGAATTT